MPLDGIESPITFDFIDKVIHLLIFLVLAVLFKLSYPKIKYYNAILVLSFYGLAIEILQQILPTGRSFDLYDWIFDILGVLIGITLTKFIFKKLKSFNQTH